MLPQNASSRPLVTFVGAGPGDPDLLTLGALRAIEAAEVILHDRLVGDAILALAPRRATLLAVGKEGFGPSMPQSETNALMIAFAPQAKRVVRLKAGDGGVFGRLDEELDALDAAGVAYRILPGITAAAAAAASIGQSLTRRGRNGSLRILTAHDVEGFAEQDWTSLARRGEVAAIYMGRRAARFLQGRLMMHGAEAHTPVTLVEYASRPEERVVAATLATLPAAAEALAGPVVILYGLAPRQAEAALPELGPELREATA